MVENAVCLTETFELLPFDDVLDIMYICAFHARSIMKIYL